MTSSEQENRSEYDSYIYDRLPHRVCAGIVLGAALAPPFSRFLLSFSWIRHVKAAAWVPLLLPRSVAQGAAMGAAGGVLEDYVTRQAYQHTVAEGRNVAVPLWTARSMLPAVMFYVNPLLCRKCLDGEQKGTDVAMAFMNGHALQQWPFFSVDLPVDVQRGAAVSFAAKFARRLWDGNYDCEDS